MSSWPFVGAVGALVTVGAAGVGCTDIPVAAADTIASGLAITGRALMHGAALSWVRDVGDTG